MATVQQLEKLHQIQRLFYVEDSLEAAVAGERVAQLIARTEQLLRQRAYLRDERRRLRIATDKVEERKNALTVMRRADWVPESLKTADGNEKYVLINIGGLMFEAPVSILKRDDKSLLAQLCGEHPPVLPDPDGGFFYFDRDWWLFRYILAFLRDGALPEDRALLSQLYREAVFWNLSSLQRAIEEERLHLRSALNKVDPKKDTSWWRKLPSWWQAVDEAKEKEKAAAATAKKKEDWWLDASYKGKVYLNKDARDDKPTTLTWSDPAAAGGYEGHAHDPYYPPPSSSSSGLSSTQPYSYATMAGRPAFAPYAPYSPGQGLGGSQHLHLHHHPAGAGALGSPQASYESAGSSGGAAAPAGGAVTGAAGLGLGLGGGGSGAGYLKPSNAWY